MKKEDDLDWDDLAIHITRLSERDWERFKEILDKDETPTDALKELFKEYKRRVVEG